MNIISPATNSGLPKAGVQFFVGQFFRIIEVRFSKSEAVRKCPAFGKPQNVGGKFKTTVHKRTDLQKMNNSK
jgi:hypothetical protein